MMIPNLILTLCRQCEKRPGICTPVMVIPIKDYPVPMYLQFKGELCQQCANSFTIRKYTDWDGSWYTMACDHLRSTAKPATNPFPNDPSFKWEEFIIKPDWEPAPMSECCLQFWSTRTLAAKGAHVPFQSTAQLPKLRLN